MTEPSKPRVLIEDWLPVTELGIESKRERAFVAAIPDLFSLHVWWARRPLVASAGVILASLLPPWSHDLAAAHPDEVRLKTEANYHKWLLHLCGIWGDPVAGKAILDRANAEGKKVKGNGYGYKQAYKNSPNPADLDLLHRVLENAWGELPNVLDPTAGGGSIPYEAVRYGLPAHANDLNQVAAVTLRAGVEIAARYGPALADELDKWGQLLIERIGERLRPYFRREDKIEKVVGYLHARSVTCPRTGKPVPLAPNWWISKAKGNEAAASLVTERNGKLLDTPEFEILFGDDAVDSDPDTGTVSRGTGLSPWDGLVIDGDYIKAEAQAGRMGSILYAVAIRLPEIQANGKTKWVRAYRAPTQTDLEALDAATVALTEQLPGWLATGIIPDEAIEDGLKTSEPLRYGMRRWRDMFSPRQLLVQGVFVEEHQRLALEMTNAMDASRAADLAALLGLMTSKATNWNSYLSSWDAGRDKVRSVFDRHDFAFKWSYGEFEGADALWSWAHERNVVNTRAIAQTLVPGSLPWALSSHTIRGEVSDLRHPVPAAATVTRGSGGSLTAVGDRSQTLICIDPPYYDNVMYGELSDFFAVWEQHTVGRAWPDLMPGGMADLKNEAVANPARFKEFGRRKSELATADYEAKMLAIFAECHRVLRDEGVMTVMFTHKRSEAWDTLGMALLEAGFSIETSWPVNTESEQSLHQAKKNSAASTIMLVCRKRSASDDVTTYFEDIEADVRAAVRDAATRFEAAGIDGVDLLLATYGPALSVLSGAWPVYSSETDDAGRSRLLRPEEALHAAREEVVRLRKAELVGRDVAFDPITDFVLIAWQTFRAEEFPYDEARRLALAIGGGDVETLAAAKILDKKSGTVKLLAPSTRKRRIYRPVIDGDTGDLPLIDIVHAVLIEASDGSLTEAKALCDRLGLLDDPQFIDLIQALVRAIPNTKLKGKWVRPEAELLHNFCTAYLPDVELPADPTSDRLFDLD